MGLWALTTEAVQGLVREHWGKKIPVGDSGEKMDTGVQDFASELLARLASQAPIKMPGPLELIQPANAPALIVHNNSGDGVVGDGTVIIQIINIDNSVTNIHNDGSITIEGGTTIVNETTGDNTFPGGATASVQVITGVTGEVNVSGCNVTLTLTPTYTTLNFENGVFTGAT